jgi:hypothetical protein
MRMSRMLRTIQESRIFIMDNEVIGAWGKTSHCIRHVALYFLFCSVHGSPT